MDEVELQWFQENSRRGLLATWSVVLMALGAIVVIFAVIVGIAIGIQPGLRDETFAIVTAAIASGAMPYAIAGILLVCAGFVARAVLTGPPRSDPHPEQLRPPPPQ